jgi:predicted CoA-binding protein
MNVTESEIKPILLKYKKMTIYGLSPDKSKPSHSVPFYMRDQGYDIVGVYPRGEFIEDVKIYKTLREVPLEYRRFVDVFRKPEAVPEVVEEVLEAGGVEVLFLQLGISHPEAEKRAEAAGIRVISNRCLYIEFNKYLAGHKIT